MSARADLFREVSACPVKADLESGLGAVQRRCCLAWSESLPGDQAKNLPLPFAELGECFCELVAVSQAGRRIRS